MNYQVLYHGTNLEYEKEQVEKHGKYLHSYHGEVQLIDDLGSAYIFARRNFYVVNHRATPAILVINPSNIQNLVRVATNGFGLSIPFLKKEEYGIIRADCGFDVCKNELEKIVASFTKAA